MLRISLILTTFIFITSLNAQSGIFIGVDGAYDIYTIANQNNYGQKELDYQDPEYQFMYGAHLGYKFNHTHQLRIGVISYRGGQSYEDNFNSHNYVKTVNLNYIGIPLTYRFTTGASENDNEGVKFYMEAGPMFSFLTDGELDHNLDGEHATFRTFYVTSGGNNPHAGDLPDINDEEAADPSTFYKSSDILAVGGLGIQAFLGSRIMLSVGINAAISLSDINNEKWQIDNNDGVYELSRNTHGGLDVSLSYLF